MVTICTASLTFNNSTFCPHSVFMCFVRISEQRAIISLYNITFCITQSKCAHCAVRTVPLNSSPPARQAALLTAVRAFHETQRRSQSIVRHLLSPLCSVLSAQPKDFCAPLTAHKPHSLPPSLRTQCLLAIFKQHHNKPSQSFPSVNLCRGFSMFVKLNNIVSTLRGKLRRMWTKPCP